MVSRAGLKPGLQPQAPPPPTTAAATTVAPLAADADDKAVTAHVADALCELAPPGAKIEMQEDTASIGGVGIKVRTREGVVWLQGMVQNGEIIERAHAIAQVASRGRKIENRLISATIFEWD